MKALLLTLTAIAALTAGFAVYSQLDESTPSRMLSNKNLEIDSIFTAWKMQYGKTYGTSSDETYRKEVFTAKYKEIQAFNANPNKTSTVGLNKFSDLTKAEFKAQYLTYRPLDETVKREPLSAVRLQDLPASIDWRTLGAVTPVKDQGQCGSCWAFSSTGSMEGAYYIKHDKLKSFSEQQLVDCAKFSYGDLGCHGGQMTHAFRYAKDYGMMLETDYPYEAKSGLFKSCNFDAKKDISKSSTYKTFSSGDLNGIMAGLTHGPVSIAIEADQSVFHDYKGGIITSGCGRSLDHGVLLVGYGTENGQDFWVVKNSWGSGWGDAGYVRIARGSDDQCGVLDNASQPEME